MKKFNKKPKVSRHSRGFAPSSKSKNGRLVYANRGGVTFTVSD